MKKQTTTKESAPTRSPRIVLFDIENFPHLGFFWDMFETNPIEVVRPSHLASFSYKVLGKKGIKTYALPDFPLYKKDKHDDRQLVEKLHELFEWADFLIAHNGVRFDVKHVNRRFIIHKMKPPSPFKAIDTLKMAKQVAAFASNKLDFLAHELGVGRKLAHTGKKLWLDCYNGDLKAWKIMKRYNARDVELLEAVYLVFRPFDKNHPDLRHFTKADNCPSCQSENTIRRGWDHKKKDKQRYYCNDCGKWFI